MNKGSKGGKGPFAVIDVGSNSIRLVIYDSLTRSPVTRFNERRLCGLGREVAKTGKLGAAGKACALDSLKRFTAIARGVGCSDIDVFATAAIREAKDGKAFVAQATKMLGQRIEVLSGAEEAHFGALGVTCGFYRPSGIMGDLGGGSVEFGLVPAERRPKDGMPAGLQSLPLGALIIGEALKDGGLEKAQSLIDAEFDRCPQLLGAAAGDTFFVVGGSWRSLARSRMAFTDHPLRVVHGYELTAEEAITLGRTMTEIDVKDVPNMPGVPRKRAETVPAAGLMLVNAVEKLRPDRVVFSATGVREGRLFDRLKRRERHRDPLLAAAEDLGRLANRGPAIGEAMIRWTDQLFPEETATQHRLRQAICHVSDTGWREHPDSRAREAFLRLLQYPFFGITHNERIALAFSVLVRYEGFRGDPLIKRTLDLVDQDELRVAETIGEALELGYRISAGAPEIIDRCRLDIDDSSIRLLAHHAAVIDEDESIYSRLRAVATLMDRDDVAMTVD